jgi:hypothetical protein
LWKRVKVAAAEREVSVQSAVALALEKTYGEAA